MYLHELDEMESVADVDVLAIDTGVNTQKVSVKTLGKKITEDATPRFASEDASTASAWTNVSVLTSGEAMKSILNKISTMFKNIRFIYKMLGTTDISDIGGGTVTGALHKLNTDVNDYSHLSFTVYSNRVTVLESSTYRCGEFVIVYFKCTANQALNENTIIQGLPVPGAKQGLSVNLGSAWAEIRASAADGIVAANISNGQTFVLFGVYNILGVPN